MSYQQRQQQQQRPRFQPPELYSISKGTVSRIEQYGCFVKLHSSPVSGLVHISQLHANRIDDVNNVVSLNDEVWVKVMDVQVETFEDEMSGKTRQRHKVKLSMKYVHQDTGQDLDPENEQLEGDMQRSRGGGGGGGGGNRGRGNLDEGGTGGASSQLGRALASNIGMSIAIDPGSLILKGKSAGGAMASTNINGYALVGEEEGEPAEPMVDHNKKLVGLSKPTISQRPVVRPMGRGRGSTLPAWMTRSDPDDRLGSMNGVPGPANGSDNGKQDDTSRDDNGKRSSRNRDNKRHRRDRHHSSSRKDRKKAKDRRKRSSSKDHRRRKGRSRSRSQSYSNDSLSEAAADGSSYHSRSRSRSPEERRRRSSHSKKRSHHSSRKSRKHHHRHGSRNRDDLSASRSRSRSQGDESPRQSTSDFANEEEARAVMERLGRLRR